MVPLRDAVLVNRTATRDAGVVDQNIDGAIPLACRGDQALDIVLVSHIGLNSQTRTTRLLNRGDGPLQ